MTAEKQQMFEKVRQPGIGLRLVMAASGHAQTRASLSRPGLLEDAQHGAIGQTSTMQRWR